MEFEKYNPEKHSDEVPDNYSNTVVPPSTTEHYEKVVEEAAEDVDEVFGIEAEFKVVIAEIDMDKMHDRFEDDIPVHAYFTGYSLGKNSHEHMEDNVIYLATSDEYEWWRSGLKDLFVHEESHQEFYVLWPNMEHEIWESIVFEGHAGHREKVVIDRKDYNWRVRQDEFEGAADRVKEELEKNREWTGDRFSRNNESQMFSFGSDDWPNAKGYVIAIEVYGDILERNNMEVNEPLTMSEDWLKEEIRDSLDKLY